MTHDYVVMQMFRTKYAGRCNIDDEHRIKRDDLVGKLQRADNPLIPVTGLACKMCIKHIPKMEN